MQIIAQEAILALPYHFKPFQIYTDACDYQLGGIIQHDYKPLASNSIKRNTAQKLYHREERSSSYSKNLKRI